MKCHPRAPLLSRGLDSVEVTMPAVDQDEFEQVFGTFLGFEPMFGAAAAEYSAGVSR
jgi:hypothetical protein